jgi:hypothetical protein
MSQNEGFSYHEEDETNAIMEINTPVNMICNHTFGN